MSTADMNQTSRSSELLRLAYVSISAQPITQALINGLLRVARPRNAASGVTGMLLCDGRLFMQELEGPPESVETLWQAIQADGRHQCVVRLFRETDAESRKYSDLKMGYGRTTPAESLATLREAQEKLTAQGDPLWANQIALLRRVADSCPSHDRDQFPLAA